MTEEQRKAEEAKREAERLKTEAKKDQPGKHSGWTYDNHPLIIKENDEDVIKTAF